MEHRPWGGSFGRPPKPTGQRPVLPGGSRARNGQLDETAGATCDLRITNPWYGTVPVCATGHWCLWPPGGPWGRF